MDKKTQIQIQEINRLMNYDRSKTLSEQILLGFHPALYDASEKAAETLVDVAKDPYKYRHEILDIISIGALFIPVIGPIISLGVDLGNAALYYHEGDTEMAGLMAAFSIIPGGELVRMIPGVKKGGVNLITKTVQKAKAGKALSKAEEEIIESIVANSSKISRRAKREFLRKTLREGFEKLTLKEKTAVFYKQIKTWYGMGAQGTGILNQGVIQISGVFITYSTIIAAYGLDGGEPNLELQKELEKHADEIGDAMLETLDENLGNTVEERDDAFIDIMYDSIESINHPEKLEGIYGPHLDMGTSQLVQIQGGSGRWSGGGNSSGPRFGNLKVIQSEPIEFEDLLSGKHVIQPGAKGDVVRHIQRILVKLGYDLGTTGKNKDGIDGDYTKNGKMESAVMKFQRDNGLDSDGDVGINTAKKLKELYYKSSSVDTSKIPLIQ